MVFSSYDIGDVAAAPERALFGAENRYHRVLIAEGGIRAALAAFRADAEVNCVVLDHTSYWQRCCRLGHTLILDQGMAIVAIW